MIHLEACAGAVLSLAFAPDGETLLVAGKDGTLRRWAPPVPLDPLPLPPGDYTALAHDAGGTRVAAGRQGGGVSLLRLSDGLIRELPAERLPVSGLAFLQSDQTLAVSVGERSGPGTPYAKPITLWDLNTHAPRPFHPGVRFGVRSMAVHPRKRLLAYATDHRGVYAHDLGKPGHLLDKKCPQDVRRIALSPDGGTVVLATDWRVEICRVDRPLESLTCAGHKGVVTSLVIPPHGRTVISGSWDRLVKVWDLATGKELQSFDWGIGRITELAIAPDGLRAAAGSDTGGVLVWDLD